MEERAVTAQRRLRKFLARSAPGLGQPLVDLRDPESGEIALTLTWQRESQSDPWRVGGLHRPTLEKRILDSVIVESRVFFLAQEDCYLPGVVKALQTLVTPEQARARRPLVAHVAQVVRGGQLMDYINGVALHEDEERRARLANISGEESIRFAVILQLDTLLRIVSNLRAQIEHDLEAGYFSLD